MTVGPRKTEPLLLNDLMQIFHVALREYKVGGWDVLQITTIQREAFNRNRLSLSKSRWLRSDFTGDKTIPLFQDDMFVRHSATIC